MVRRHRKRSRKYLGSRSHGGGNAKNRRGKGSKGGKGFGGGHKHKWSRMVKLDHFGVHGFAPINKEHVEVLNLGDITRKIENGKIKEKEGKYFFDFEGKILGSGKISEPVVVKAKAFSKNAVEKIKQAGGEARINGEKNAA
ncbi:uL15 family ribosomal protein [Candidatus Micrarchaeota archaeon]|nr:uL15 family ribosomal protein [Candidatus Micrarchaeota archaeon]